MKIASMKAGFGLFLLLCFLGCATGFPKSDAAALYYNLGNAYFDLKRFPEAAEAYQNAMAMDKELFQASYNLARVYIESGDVEKGIEELNRLLKETPENTILLNTLAYALTLSGKSEAALAVYEGTLARNRFDLNALYNKTILLWKLERLNEALAAALDGFDQAPTDKDVLKNLCGIYSDLGLTAEAIPFFEAYVALVPTDTGMLTALADAYNTERYYGKALETYEAALAVDKALPKALFEKARILLVVVGDGVLGLEALGEAVTAGFNDKISFVNLVKDPDLLNSAEVLSFLENKEIITGDDLLEPDPDLEEEEAGGQNDILPPAYPENL